MFIILYIEVVFPKKPVTLEDQSIALNMFSNKKLKKLKKKKNIPVFLQNIYEL